MPGRAQNWNSLTHFQSWRQKGWAVSIMALPSYLKEGTPVPSLRVGRFHIRVGLKVHGEEKDLLPCRGLTADLPTD